MSDDWKVGDLALCVNDRKRVFGVYYPAVKSTTGVALGRVYTVSGVVGRVEGPWGPSDLLAIDGLAWEKCLSGGIGAWRFIKVTPPEADAFDYETIELMNRKPVEAVS